MNKRLSTTSSTLQSVNSYEKSNEIKSIRSIVSKIELKSNDVYSQLNKISTEYYNINLPSSLPAKDQYTWSFIDEKLYNEAKQSYDEILAIYIEKPKVYRFQSTKEIIWKYNEELAIKQLENEQLKQKNNKKIVKRTKKVDATTLLAKQLIQKKKEEDVDDNITVTNNDIKDVKDDNKDVHENVDVLDSYLDPFVVPKPWKVDTRNGKFSYYNPVTRERTNVKPGELWKDKLQLLMKLTRREDEEGYEYKESDPERRRRMLLRSEYEKKLADEIKRRTNEPNDLEKIEDLLFDMVETVAQKIDKEKQTNKQAAFDKARSIWNVVTKGYKMKKLIITINNSIDESIHKITDSPYYDVILTNTSQVLSVDISKHVLDRRLHEHDELVDSQSNYNHNKLKWLFDNEVYKRIKSNSNELVIPKYLTSIPKKIKTIEPIKLINNVKSYGYNQYIKLYKNIKNIITNEVSDKYISQKINIDMLFSEAIESNKYSMKTLLVTPVHLSNKLFNFLSSRPDRLDNTKITNKLSDCIEIKLILSIDVPPIYILRKKTNFKFIDLVNKLKKNKVILEPIVKSTNIFNNTTSYLTNYTSKNIAKFLKRQKNTENKQLTAIHNQIKQLHSRSANNQSNVWDSNWESSYITNDKILRNVYKQRDIDLNDDISNNSSKKSASHIEVDSKIDNKLSDTRTDNVNDNAYGNTNEQVNNQVITNIDSPINVENNEKVDNNEKVENIENDENDEIVENLLDNKEEDNIAKTIVEIPSGKLDYSEIDIKSVRRISSIKDNLANIEANKASNHTTEEEFIIDDDISNYIFDTTSRKTFENQLISDISISTLLPKSNITIDEVRRLNYHSTYLSDLKYEQTINDKLFYLQEEESIYLSTLQQQLKIAINNGEYIDFLYQQDIIEIIKEYSEKFPQSKSIYTLNLGDEKVINAIMTDKPIDGQTNNDSINLSAETIQNKKDLRKVINKNKVNGLDIGKSNPSKLLNDSTYWFNKSIYNDSTIQVLNNNAMKSAVVKPIDKHIDKQITNLKSVRLRKLQLLVYEKSFQSKLDELNRLKYLSIYHVNNYIESIRDVLDPVVSDIYTNMNKLLKSKILKDVSSNIQIDAMKHSMIDNKEESNESIYPQEIIDLLNDMCNIVEANYSINKLELNVINNLIDADIIQDNQLVSDVNSNSVIIDPIYRKLSEKLDDILKEKNDIMVQEELLEKSISQSSKLVSQPDDSVDITRKSISHLDGIYDFNSVINNTVTALIMTIEDSDLNISHVSDEINQLVDDIPPNRIDHNLFSLYLNNRNTLTDRWIVYKSNNVINYDDKKTLKSAQSHQKQSYGTEITIRISIKDFDKLTLNLPDLQSSDIIQLLLSQFSNPQSIFRCGEITSHVIDIKVKDNVNCNRKVYPNWESYWIHFIHPVFFGYSTNSIVRNQYVHIDTNGYMDIDSSIDNQTINEFDSQTESKVDSLAHNPINSKISINVYDPRSRFSERTRSYYHSLERKNVNILKVRKRLAKKKEREKKLKQLLELQKEKQLDNAIELDDSKIDANMDNKVDIKLDSDSSSDDSYDNNTIKLEYYYDKQGKKILKLYKPSNLNQLNNYDIIKLKKIYKEYEKIYDNSLKKVQTDKSIIVGSNNIPIYVYNALRNKDLAYHYYYIGKMKFERKQIIDKINKSIHLQIPKQKLTTINETDINNWIEESKQLDIERLYTIRRNKQENRYKIKKNKFIRLQNDIIKNWLIEKFILLSHDKKRDLISNLIYNYLLSHDELNNQLDIKTDSNKFDSKIGYDNKDELEKQELLRYQQFLSISEEKKTRSLFIYIKIWLNGYTNSIQSNSPHTTTNSSNETNLDNYFGLADKYLDGKIFNKNSNKNNKKKKLINDIKSTDQNDNQDESIEDTIDTISKKDFWDFLDIVFLSINEHNERKAYDCFKNDAIRKQSLQMRRRESLSAAIKQLDDPLEQTVLRRKSIYNTIDKAVDNTLNQIVETFDIVNNNTTFEFTPIDSIDKSFEMNTDIAVSYEPQLLRRPTVFENMSNQAPSSRRPSTRQSIVNYGLFDPNGNSSINADATSLHRVNSHSVDLFTRPSTRQSIGNVSLIERDMSISLKRVSSHNIDVMTRPATRQSLNSYSLNEQDLPYPTSNLDNLPIASNLSRLNSHTADVLIKTASLSIRPNPITLHSMSDSRKHESNFTSILNRNPSIDYEIKQRENYRNIFTQQQQLLINPLKSKEFEMLEKKYLVVKKELDQIPIHKRLKDEDIQKLMNIQWINILSTYPILLTCFKQLPTMIGTTYSNNEVIQFAIILVQLSPMFAQVILNSQDSSDNQSIGSKSSKDETNSIDPLVISKSINYDSIPEETPLSPSNMNQMESIKGKSISISSEKSLISNISNNETSAIQTNQMNQSIYNKLKAHNHKYIQLPDEKIAYCVICKESDVEEWIDSHIYLETNYQIEFDNKIKVLESSIDEMIEEVKTEFKNKDNIYKILHDYMSKFEQNRMLIRYNKYINKLRYVDGLRDLDINNIDISNINDLIIEQLKYSLPPHVLRSGVSYIDPNGNVIIPVEKPINESIKVIDSTTLIETLNELPIDIIEDSRHDDDKFGLKIRVWSCEKDIRGDYLGELILTEKDLLNPPKGRRLYYLQFDSRCLSKNQEPNVNKQGSLTIRLNISKVDKATNAPIAWKLVIYSASNLQENKKSNPYCEVCWFGPVDKPVIITNVFDVINGYEIIDESIKSQLDKADFNVNLNDYESISNIYQSNNIKQWVRIGNTKPKYRTNEPVYTKFDNNIFDMPPCYTNYPLIDRIDRKVNCYFDGGWIAKNYLPDLNDEIIRKTILEREIVRHKNSNIETPSSNLLTLNNQTEKEYNNTDSSNANNIEEIKHKNTKEKLKRLLKLAIKSIIKQNLFNKLVDDEARIRINTTKILLVSEENERKLMSSEEIYIRRYELDEQMNIAKSHLKIQEDYYKEYSKLIQHIVAPSKVLTRLSYMMAKTIEGGGLSVVCQDPTSHSLVDVIAMPILYPDDEQLLINNVTALLGISCPYLVKVIDCGVYYVRKYTCSGYIGINERISMIVMEKYDGSISLLEYLNTYSITNEELKLILLQIIIGIEKLHEINIIHRNLNPNSIYLELPNGYKKTSSFQQRDYKVDASAYLSQNTELSNYISKTKKKIKKEVLRNRVLCRIGDFWFLHNPRKPGCEYSYGRVDWGNQITTPPEVMNGYKMTHSADIYAFGVCIFYWVTNGLNLPDLTGKDIDIIKPLIPYKWSPWLMTLLNMCLQRNPNNRASTKEIQAFLRLKSYQR